MLGCAVLAACGGNDDGGDGGGNDQCPPYVNIVGGSFARSGATTTWTMEVEDLPATLPFDRVDVPANTLEYKWAIELDPNGDGIVDLDAAMLHFRLGNAPETEQPVLTGTQQDLWTRMGAAGEVSGDVTVTIAGNVITFVLDDAEDPLLPTVTSVAQGTLKTHVSLGGVSDRCEDLYRL